MPRGRVSAPACAPPRCPPATSSTWPSVKRLPHGHARRTRRPHSGPSARRAAATGHAAASPTGEGRVRLVDPEVPPGLRGHVRSPSGVVGVGVGEQQPGDVATGRIRSTRARPSPWGPDCLTPMSTRVTWPSSSRSMKPLTKSPSRGMRHTFGASAIAGSLAMFGAYARSRPSALGHRPVGELRRPHAHEALEADLQLLGELDAEAQPPHARAPRGAPRPSSPGCGRTRPRPRRTARRRCGTARVGSPRS